MNRSGWRTVALVVTAAGLGAAGASAQVLETPEGRVEFIGLRHWTPEQVRDTLAALRPDVPLSSGACAAVLQLQAGFPQAAVYKFSFADRPSESHTLITLVEPEERDRVRYHPPPPDSLGPQERWAEAYDILQGSRGWAWHIADQYRDRIPGPELWARMEGVDTMDFHVAHDFLESHATEEDFRLALETLARDRNGLSRIVAIGILGSFPEREETWHALIRAARGFGPLDWGHSQAASTINGLRSQAPDSIDWSPVADDLSALLNGTNLFAFMPVLEVLARTGLPPELTRELLAGGAPLLMDHLAAKSPMPRQTARLFLEGISGENHGDDIAAWREWIASLRV